MSNLTRMTGVFNLSLHNAKTGELIRTIHKTNYDTLAGRINNTFGSSCYMLRELYVNYTTVSLPKDITSGVVKMSLYPDEPMFCLNYLTFKGSLTNSKFAVSYDNGVTWWKNSGGTLAEITYTDQASLITNGMSLDDIQSMVLATHLPEYSNHVMVAISIASGDHFTSYTGRFDYEPTLSDSNTVRWVGEVKGISRYNITTASISSGKTTVGSVTTYDIQYSNIGGTEDIRLRTILAESNSGGYIATFANVDITIEPDQVLSGKYEITVSSATDLGTQRSLNALYAFTGTTSPTYSDSVFGASIAKTSGMYMLAPAGANGPVANGTFFPVLADEVYRKDCINRILFMVDAHKIDHNYVDAVTVPTSTGKVAVTSSNSNGTSGLSAFPAYLRFHLQSTGTQDTATYVAYIQHRPEALISGTRLGTDTTSSICWRPRFLKRPELFLPWDYINYEGMAITTQGIPKYAVNPFDDLILEVFDNELRISQYSIGTTILSITPNQNETFKMAWAVSGNPSGRDLYVVSYNSVSTLTTLFDLPVTFTSDSITRTISATVNGDLTIRTLLANVSDPVNGGENALYSFVYGTMLQNALSGTDTSSALLTSLETSSSKAIGSYSHSAFHGNSVVSGNTIYDQKWGWKNLTSSGGVVLDVGSGGEDVLAMDGTGYCYCDESSDNGALRTPYRTGPVLFANVQATSYQSSVPMQLGTTGVRFTSSHAIIVDTNFSGGLANLSTLTYGYFCGGRNATDTIASNSVYQLSPASDTTTLVSRGTLVTSRSGSGSNGNSDYGYIGWGWGTSGGGAYCLSTLEKYSHANGTSASVSVTLGNMGSGSFNYYAYMGVSWSQSMGFWIRSATYNSSNTSSEICRYTYSSDTAVLLSRASYSISSGGSENNSAVIFSSSSLLWHFNSTGVNFTLSEYTVSTGTAVTTAATVTGLSSYGSSLNFYSPVTGYAFDTENTGYFSVRTTSTANMGYSFNKVVGVTTVNSRLDLTSSGTNLDEGKGFCTDTTGYSVMNGNQVMALTFANDTSARVVKSTAPSSNMYASTSIHNALLGKGRGSDLGNYSTSSKTKIALFQLGPASNIVLTSSGVQMVDGGNMGPLAWMTIGGKLVTSTNYDTVGGHTSSDRFTGKMDNVNLLPMEELDSLAVQYPVLFSISSVSGFSHKFGSEPLFTLAISGLSGGHYFINTAASDAITLITDGNRSSVTPVNIAKINSKLDAIKAYFDPSCKVGLIYHSMPKTNGRYMSQTYATITCNITSLPNLDDGMTSAAVYSETTTSARTRLVNRLFMYNGCGVIQRQYDKLRNAVTDATLTDFPSIAGKFESLQVEEVRGGYFILVRDEISTEETNRLIFWPKDGRCAKWVKLTDKVTGLTTNHSLMIGVKDHYTGNWSLQYAGPNPSSASVLDKSRTYMDLSGNRVLCLPATTSVESGALTTATRKGMYPLCFNTDGTVGFNYPYPDLAKSKFTHTASSSTPKVWGNLSWLFTNGVATPHFANTEIVSLIIGDYTGIATDNWQTTSLFTMIMYSRTSINQRFFGTKIPLVNGRSILPGLYMGEVDRTSTPITEPTAQDRFFIV